MKGKKAAEMTIGTIIIIILALVVLVFLIFSFSRSGGSLMDNIANFFGGGSNVDTVVRSCQAACTTMSTYDYNQLTRQVKFDSNFKADLTCVDLESEIVFDKTLESIDSACQGENCKTFPAPITEPCTALA